MEKLNTGPRTWTRDDVASRILAGETLFVHRGNLIRVPPAWLKQHPGGALAILHYVGRDATDEVEAFHPDATLERIRKHSVGRVDTSAEGFWEPMLPPVASGWVRQSGSEGKETWSRIADIEAPESPKDSTTNPISFTSHNYVASEILLVEKSQKSQNAAASLSPNLSTITPPTPMLSAEIQNKHAKSFRDLHRKITQAGLYQTRYIAGYGPEVLRYITLAAASYIAYQCRWFIPSAVFLGLLWHQLTFTAHDLGHMGVTHSWFWDRLIGITIADFIGGLSIGWWVDNHNIHHLVPNHPTHDPDIQHVPIIAISPAFLGSLYSTYYNRVMRLDAVAKVLLKFQHRLYYVILSLARFNLYTNSYAFLFKKGILQGKRPWLWYLEIVGMSFFWYWYGRVLAGCGSWNMGFAYLMISHIVSSPVHVQIVLSHFSQSTADLGPTESFVDRQLRTTSDVICSPSIEFIHGGLHLQVTHHLFPRLPRHNLRGASLMVKEFAQENDLEYAEFKWLDGNREVLGVLESVAEQVKILGLVADHEIQERLGQVPQSS